MNTAMGPIRSDFFQFLKDQVLSVTEITRTTKLTEILDMYASVINSDKVYVVQNSRNKDAQAVIANAEYFQELLLYKEAVEDAIDQVMYDVAFERKNDVGEVSIAQVVSDFDLDLHEILALDPEEI